MIFKTLRHLSLDIVAGSLGQLHLFSGYFGVVISWEVYALLGSAVWLIYTADHIIDGTSIKQPIKDRYLFHRSYKTVLLVAMALVAVCGLVLLFRIPSNLLIYGLLLSALSIAYLLLSKWLGSFFSKELLVAIVYALGIFLPLIGSVSVGRLVVPSINLAILAFINLISISHFEREVDTKEGIASLASKLSVDNMEWMLLVLTIFSLAFSLLSGFTTLAFYFLCVGLIYLGLVRFKVWASQKSRYRVLSDGAFLLSFIFALF